MVLPSAFPLLLLCIVFLMCGKGNAGRDLEGKYATAYFHKTSDSANHFDGGDVKNLEDKYSTAYFHKAFDAENLDREKEVTSLEDKYATAYFHKTSDSESNGEGKEVKGLEDKYATAYFHKTSDSENHFNGGDVKNLEDKYSTAYFHKAFAAENLDREKEVKGLEDKYATAYFHKTSNSESHGEGKEVKGLEDKYTTAYFHKTSDSESHDEGKEVKGLEDKYAMAYFHKTSDSESEVKSLGDKYATAYFHQTSNSESHGERKAMKSLEDKYSTAYFHKAFDLETKSLQQSSEMENHNMEHHHNHHNHVGSAEIGLFTIDELRGFNVGKKLPIFFPIKNHSLYPPFLPKEVADTIPFSSSQLSNILQFFSVSPNSPKGKAVQDTLIKCELEAAQGETKICATSLESLLDFLSNAFGPDVDFKFISTRHPTITTPIFQNYTVLESPREIESPKKVACHPMPYLYAVHFCHFDATETKAFRLQLVGDISGDKVDALVVCHMDTSGWSTDHAAFRMLGIKQGNAVCHVFSQGNLVWIQPPVVTVSAM
ncbi:hypothetical protein E1A91_D07G122300v1 [Gossypium mustelinum]|uniref:BURP domain-containing protein n=1 Tax=Gossypium mustelinum TaxID=34275 RepID=A0A5D2U9N3_GOSMU|nr:hypothetical protein E1A91_D07G122300v1 [Gossypium mustelinum]